MTRERAEEECMSLGEAYTEGYQQGKADADDERANLLAFICKKYNIPLVDMNCTVEEWEQLKEKKNERNDRIRNGRTT